MMTLSATTIYSANLTHVEGTDSDTKKLTVSHAHAEHDKIINQIDSGDCDLKKLREIYQDVFASRNYLENIKTSKKNLDKKFMLAKEIASDETIIFFLKRVIKKEYKNKVNVLFK